MGVYKIILFVVVGYKDIGSTVFTYAIINRVIVNRWILAITNISDVWMQVLFNDTVKCVLMASYSMKII